MSGSEFPVTLLDLCGSIALLLWGVHMVQTGVQRAFGARLRAALGTALGRPATALLAGLCVTTISQSSTATGLIVTGFAADGLINLVPALAVMLGANVGTTLIVQLLSFDLSPVSPALILSGVLMFRRGQSSRMHDLGRVAIGLGLMLLALHQLLDFIAPVENARGLNLLLGAIAAQPLLDVILACGLTWAAHSSVAVVLLVMSLAAKGVVSLDAAFALVLGANLGTAINPLLEASDGKDASARRVPAGNLGTRLLGVAIGLAVLPKLGPWLVEIEPNPGRAVADFHLGFNLLVAILFFPVLPHYAALLRRLFPVRVDAPDPSRPVYLDGAARETPIVAIAAAAREALRLADILEAMLLGACDAFATDDRKRVGAARRMDDALDRLNHAIKAYLSGLDTEATSDSDQRRIEEILTFTINLESAGDVVDRNLLDHAAKRSRRNIVLSSEQTDELSSIIARLVVNLRTAASVFMTEDVRAARLLAAEKEAFRNLEAVKTEAHFTQIRAGRTEAAERSAWQLDLFRDLKRINDHLVAAAAYPVLSSQGELLPSRLRENE
jgi:phosphate:Na+ symporter